jgi:hypothetical protein
MSINYSQYTNQTGDLLLDLGTPVSHHVKFQLDNGGQVDKDTFTVCEINDEEFEKKVQTTDKYLTLVRKKELEARFPAGISIRVFREPKECKSMHYFS